MMKIKLIVLITLIIIFSLTLTGCWDYEEYEDLIQVSAMGFDYDKNTGNIIFSVQYIPTSKGVKSSSSESSNGKPQKENIHSTSAKTIYEAVAKLQQVIFKKLFYGYLKVIVIGNDAAKYKMLDIIELLDRNPLIRSSTYIVITSGKAEDAMSTFDAGMAAPSSEEINKMINLSNDIGTALAVSLQDFESKLAIPGIEAAAPRLITISNIPKPFAEGGTEDNIKYDLARPGDHRVAGIAAFKGDKLIGWLNEKESLGLRLISGKKVIAYKVSNGSNKLPSEDIFYYRLSRSKGKIKVEINNDKPAFEVDVKVAADLRKYYSHKGSDFLGPKEVSIMEKKLSNSVQSDITAALRRGQKELKTDIFGFGFALFREDPQLWRSKYDSKWDKLFPDMPISVKVDAKILNTGTNIRRLYVR